MGKFLVLNCSLQLLDDHGHEGEDDAQQAEDDAEHEHVGHADLRHSTLKHFNCFSSRG